MKYHKVKMLKAEKFRRLTGVKKGTFEKMLEVLNAASEKLHERGGRHAALPMADRLLLMLEYLREYRTYFHIAENYGISESACCRTVHWVEKTLIASGIFHLPGRKALLGGNAAFEVYLVDATESPVERPKKSSAGAIPERRSAIP
jgi:hypothetical protein